MSRHLTTRVWLAAVLAVSTAALARADGQQAATPSVQPLPRVAGATPRNVVFILADDHRYDAMSFLGHPIARTPGMDRIADKARIRNAFVTTALCSPSRASILTGLYTYRHRWSTTTADPGWHVFFPQYSRRPGTRPRSSASGTWATTTSRSRALTTGSASPGRAPTALAYWLNVDGKRVPQRATSPTS